YGPKYVGVGQYARFRYKRKPANLGMAYHYYGTTKHCLPLAWTKKSMCMTPKQEENHKQGQIQMYNMSDVHKLIQVNGDHMSFFTKEKNPIVIDALNSIFTLLNNR